MYLLNTPFPATLLELLNMLAFRREVGGAHDTGPAQLTEPIKTALFTIFVEAGGLVAGTLVTLKKMEQKICCPRSLGNVYIVVNVTMLPRYTDNVLIWRKWTSSGYKVPYIWWAGYKVPYIWWAGYKVPYIWWAVYKATTLRDFSHCNI